ncbi:MAG: PPC domain-containing DNA-binding protein [Clostridia bacterium]
MKYKVFDNKVFVRFDPGEEVVANLKDLCETLDIQAGSLSAIGALGEATIGFFNPEIKQYHQKELTGDFEITSMIGNISTMDGAVYLHIHITLGDENFKVIGGHFDRGIVSATCEMVIDIANGSINRVKGKKFNLNLFDF